MTQDLHDRLSDLADEVPTHVVADAGAAWRTGARRRTTHRIGITTAVLVMFALAAGAVAWLPGRVAPVRPASPHSSGVDGYPEDVAQPWAERDLPEAPGPMAEVYERSGGSWWVASADGRTWRVPQEGMIDSYPPALSPDGRRLGYLADRRTYVIRDLGSGEVTTYPGIADGGTDQARPRWFLASQAPGYWSPSGDRLLVRVGYGADELVLDRDGTMTPIRHAGFPAGWVDDDTLAFLTTDGRGRHPRLELAGLDGRDRSSVSLDLPRRTSVAISQWSGSISPDGTLLALQDADATGDVRIVQVSTGRVLRHQSAAVGDTCLVSWRDNEPVLARGGSLVSYTNHVVTTYDPGLESACVLAAADALTGERHGGQRWWSLGADWLTVHLWVMPATFVAVVVLLLGPPLVVRRRRRRSSTS